MESLPTRTGRCLCGAVTFAFEPAHAEVDACHCGMCQRWGGGPGLSIKAAAMPRITGDVAVYQSSEWGYRHFCKVCGSHLFYTAPSADYIGVTAGSLDDQSGLSFTTEIFIDCKPAYYTFANDTTRLTEAEFLAMLSQTSSTSDANG